MFGSNNKPSLFGNASNTTAFGSTSTFGTATNTFGMGQQQQQQPSLFGQNTGGGFGSSNTTSTGLFGQPQQPGGLFGSSTGQQAQPSAFGNQPSTGAFGGGGTSSGGGLFGSAANNTQSQSIFGAPRFGAGSTTSAFGTTSSGLQAGGLGSSIVGTTVRFNPQLSTDTMVKNGINQSINTRHQCITCMKEYENKSLEELRFEDYQANRKGPSSTTTSMFGAGQPTNTAGQTGTGGLFSSTSTPSVSFNTNTSGNSLFSTNKPPFGAATTTTTTSIFSGSFGANKPFGSSAPAFGTAQPAQAPTATPAPGSLFGAPSSTTTTGFGTQSNLFGMNTAPQTQNKSFFGTTTTTQPSLFGTNSAINTQTNLGGAAKPMFGTSAPAFGAPTTSNSGFTFSSTSTANAPGTSLFGAGTGQTSLFGANNATQNQAAKPPMFNFPSQTNTQATGLQTNTTGSLFNTGGLSTGLNTGGSNLFGTTPASGGSLFSNSGTATLGGSSLLGGTQQNPLQLQPLGQPATQNTALQSPPVNNNVLARLLALPYGTSPLFQNLISTTSSSSLKFTTDPKTLNQYKVNFSNSNQSSNKSVRIANQSTCRNSLLFEDYEDESLGEKKTAADIFVPRKSIKKLVIRPKDDSTSAVENPITASNSAPRASVAGTSHQPGTTTLSDRQQLSQLETTVMEFYRPPPLPSTAISMPVATSSSEQIPTSPQQTFTISKSPDRSITERQLLTSSDTSRSSQNLASPFHLTPQQAQSSNITAENSNYSLLGTSDPLSPLVHATSGQSILEYRCKVICTRPNYYIFPPLEQLDQFFDENESSCIVENFSVGRHDYGSIYWEGPLDVYGLNIDELVHIRRKEVIVYPDDENKAEHGTGLNRPAQITLHKVWPVDKASRDLIKDVDRLQKMGYEEKIENATIKFGGIFKEYRPETGTWVFGVKHFSKYGLLDEDDDEAENQASKQAAQMATSETHPKQLEPFAFSQSKPSDLKFHGLVGFEQSQRFDDYNRMFEEEEEGEDFDGTDIFGSSKPPIVDEDELIPPVNNYYNSLRNALFDQDEQFETLPSTKKTKKLVMLPDHFLKPDFESAKQIDNEMLVLSQAPIKLNLVRKRELVLDEQLIFSSDQRVSKDISSIKFAPFPKVRFFAGGNQFLMINKRRVDVCILKLFPAIDNQQENRFEHQLNNNSVISSCDPSSTFIQSKRAIANPFNLPSLEQLISALYHPLDFHNQRAYDLERTNLVMDWLSEQNLKLPVPKNTYQAIIHYLAGNDIKSAVELAIKSRNPKLAFALNFDNTLECKNNVLDQLNNWKTHQIDRFIPTEILRIYVLLSGDFKFRTSSGTEVEVLNGLSWTQQLNLLLLFSINNGLASCIEKLTCPTNDVEYHLIGKNSPLVAMSATENTIEAWFLHQSLKSYGIIDRSTNSNIIHGQVAGQLLAQSIRWSAFAALHINDELLRDYALRELLLQHIPHLSRADEEWLQSNLLVSAHFIAEAKSIYAKSYFDHANLALHLIKQGNLTEAHDTLINYIFPELVINEENTQLRRLLNEIKPYRDHISGWYTSGAHIYDVYCRAVEDDVIDQNMWDETFDFAQMQCNNRRQLLCKSEIARKLNLIRYGLNDNRFMLKMPVPSDYALSEVKSNFVALLKNLSTC